MGLSCSKTDNTDIKITGNLDTDSKHINKYIKNLTNLIDNYGSTQVCLSDIQNFISLISSYYIKYKSTEKIEYKNIINIAKIIEICSDSENYYICIKKTNNNFSIDEKISVNISSLNTILKMIDKNLYTEKIHKLLVEDYKDNIIYLSAHNVYLFALYKKLYEYHNNDDNRLCIFIGNSLSNVFTMLQKINDIDKILNNKKYVQLAISGKAPNLNHIDLYLKDGDIFREKYKLYTELKNLCDEISNRKKEDIKNILGEYSKQFDERIINDAFNKLDDVNNKKILNKMIDTIYNREIINNMIINNIDCYFTNNKIELDLIYRKLKDKKNVYLHDHIATKGEGVAAFFILVILYIKKNYKENAEVLNNISKYFKFIVTAKNRNIVIEFSKYIKSIYEKLNIQFENNIHYILFNMKDIPDHLFAQSTSWDDCRIVKNYSSMLWCEPENTYNKSEICKSIVLELENPFENIYGDEINKIKENIKIMELDNLKGGNFYVDKYKKYKYKYINLIKKIYE